MNDPRQAMRPYQERFNQALASYLQSLDAPELLRDAMEYIALGEGKRIRPVLVLATADELGADPFAAMPAAIALEMVHAYSLAHDDLPALDDDDERRGRPSAHRKFDEPIAILAGDALLTEAFAALTACQDSVAPIFVVRMVESLSRLAGSTGMVGGQVLDIKHLAEDSKALREMHAMKTGALFRCALQLGALSAEVCDTDVSHCDRYGELFGAAFQLSDDILDLDEIADSDHEREVNIAHIDGVVEVREEVRSLCDEARSLLGRFDPPMELHHQLLDWVETRGLGDE